MRGNRGPYQVWSLRGKRGQRLVIDVASSTFDAYLIVRNSDGFLVGSDDDSGENLNARLRTILPRSGTYRLIVTAVGADSRGDYTVSVSEWPAPDAPPAGQAQTLKVGQTRDGVLEPGDEFSGDGPYQDRWTFEARAEQRLRVEMRSTDVDSYLMLLGPDGRVLGTDDDGLGNRDAVVTVRATSAGPYTALATTYGDQPRVGAYRVALQELTGEFSEPGAVVSLGEGETREGRLEAGDSAHSGGGWMDIYEFRATRSGTAVFDLSSEDFDPVLALLDQSGKPVQENDDFGGTRNSQISLNVTAGAAYRLTVRAWAGGSGAGGSYRISARVSS
jgi:serine protease Do